MGESLFILISYCEKELIRSYSPIQKKSLFQILINKKKKKKKLNGYHYLTCRLLPQVKKRIALARGSPRTMRVRNAYLVRFLLMTSTSLVSLSLLSILATCAGRSSSMKMAPHIMDTCRKEGKNGGVRNML